MTEQVLPQPGPDRPTEVLDAMRRLVGGELLMEDLAPEIVAGLEHMIGSDRQQLERFFAGRRAREARSPQPGRPAPDFELELLSVDGKRTGQRRRLADHRGRSVALIFGSYT